APGCLSNGSRRIAGPRYALRIIYTTHKIGVAEAPLIDLRDPSGFNSAKHASVQHAAEVIQFGSLLRLIVALTLANARRSWYKPVGSSQPVMRPRRPRRLIDAR